MTFQIRQSSLALLLSLLVAITLFVGCKSRTSDANDLSDHPARVPAEMQPLYDEIMTAHDEVMPKMSELTKLQDQMLSILDTLRAQEPVSASALSEANKVLGKLNQAENAMWTWMHNFGKLDSIPDGEKEIFLNSEKTAALSMRDLMLEGIEKAQLYISQNATPNAL